MGTTYFGKQRDPNTLKVKRDSATGKIQTVSVSCAYCEDGKMPRYVDITLSDFVDCPCTAPWYPSPDTYQVIGVAAIINNNIYRVQHKSGCEYQKTFVGEFGIERHWPDSNDCTGDYFDCNFDRLEITITAEDGRAHIEIWTYTQGAPACGGPIFDGYINYSEGESCLDTENVGHNDIEACYPNFLNQSAICGSTGQVSLSIP